MSRDEKVDPVGACVGHRGSRVQAVVNELYDEKIDIVRWNVDTGLFIGESLSPAKAVKVNVKEEDKSAFVIVPDNQLSLAIGKAGQNVRLAARLTGWRIDIRSEAQVARAALMAMTSHLESSDEEEDETDGAIERDELAPPLNDDVIAIGSPSTGNGHHTIEDDYSLEQSELEAAAGERPVISSETNFQ